MNLFCWTAIGVLLVVACANAQDGDPECFSVKDGSDYRGSLSTTIYGVECQAWTSQEPHIHDRTPENYGDYGIGNHNYCRNPDGELGAWCYTTDNETRWAYCNVGQVNPVPCDEELPANNAEYWSADARQHIDEALEVQDSHSNRIAKNVVLMVGDGLDLSTITAARIKKKGVTGVLTLETLPHLGLLKTFSSNWQVTDSAPSSTALFSGAKTVASALGVDGSVVYDDCESVEDATIPSVMEELIAVGKSAGIVTTRHINDATPAALCAHSPNRRWESDSDMPQEAIDAGCLDTAAQLLENGAGIQVLLGGGREDLLPNDTPDPEYPDVYGTRTDERNLIEEWLEARDDGVYCWNLTCFRELDTDNTPYLLGLFEPKSMKYENERGMDTALEPPIAAMAETALDILKQNDEGFFLMIEGGQIDPAHHGNNAQNALVETIAFDFALNKVLEQVDLDETLVIITSDHAQGMTLSGYSTRDNSVLGLNDQETGEDGLPFTTLGYANGPGGTKEKKSYEETGARRDLTDEDTAHPDFIQSGAIPLESSTHEGEEVPVMAGGPMAHMFHHTHDNTYVAHVIRMATCIGDYEEDCSRTPPRKKYRKQKP